jgi:cephalosporin hydroxylase
MNDFDKEVQKRIAANAANADLVALAKDFVRESTEPKYSYNFSALGRPIIQYPQDMIAMQELIWKVKPDLIIETGIAHGGSLIMSAAMLATLDYCDAVESGQSLDPRNTQRRVLGIDIDIRAHNRGAIEAHPMSHRIDMIQGSSIAPDIVARVAEIASNYQRVLVCLDSNHTHDHVLAELEGYAPLTSKDSYCIVFDTLIDELPDAMYPDRPWAPGNNPKTALHAYMAALRADGRRAADGAPLFFEIDKSIDDKLLITVAPGGYLKRVTA